MQEETVSQTWVNSTQVKNTFSLTLQNTLAAWPVVFPAMVVPPLNSFTVGSRVQVPSGGGGAKWETDRRRKRGREVWRRATTYSLSYSSHSHFVFPLPCPHVSFFWPFQYLSPRYTCESACTYTDMQDTVTQDTSIRWHKHELKLNMLLHDCFYYMYMCGMPHSVFPRWMCQDQHSLHVYFVWWYVSWHCC